MKLLSLSLAVVFVLAGFPAAASASASDDVVLLNYENAFEHGYWVRCAVKDKKSDGRKDPTKRVENSEPVEVIFRLGLVNGGRLHDGQFAVNMKNLQVIKRASLVIRDGESVLLDVPLRLELDPGNRVHLSAEFTVPKESLPKMQVEFKEHLERDNALPAVQPVAVDLEQFINKPSTPQTIQEARP